MHCAPADFQSVYLFNMCCHLLQCYPTACRNISYSSVLGLKSVALHKVSNCVYNLWVVVDNLGSYSLSGSWYLHWFHWLWWRHWYHLPIDQNKGF
jgi:hypothetical protein